MTILQSHLTTPAYADPKQHCTGMSPSMQTLLAARQSFLHASTYRRHGHLFCGLGSIANVADDGYDFINRFNIFYPATDPVDTSQTTRRMQVRIWCYQEYDTATNEINVFLNGSATATYTEDTTGYISRGVADRRNEWQQPENGLKLIDLIVNANTLESQSLVASGVGRLYVRIDGVRVHSVFAWALPEKSVSNERCYGIGAGNFQTGDPLRGYDTGLNGSVDSMVQRQYSREAIGYRDTFLNSSRRVLFGHGHACGYYCSKSSGDAGYISLMDASFRPHVAPRNLRKSTGVVTVDLAFAYRSDANTKIRFRSVSAGDTFEYTFAAQTTIVPRTEIAALDIDAEGDDIIIDCWVSTTIACEIHSIAIIESGTY